MDLDYKSDFEESELSGKITELRKQGQENSTETDKSNLIDGRQERATRTRLSIIDALLDLIVEGDLSPTARQIAVRAGVSERSVFQHFVDLESLHRAVAERQLERTLSMVEEIPSILSFHERVEKFIDQRGRILEALTPVRRAALAIEPHSQEIRRSRDLFYSLAKEQIEKVFQLEIESSIETDKESFISALDLVCSWNSWEYLRVQGHSIVGSKAVMKRALLALLKESCKIN